MTRYATVVADPPWDHQDRLSRLRWRHGRPSGSDMPLDYESMTVVEIAMLPVPRLAAPDAHIFLWTTQRYLRAAFDVLDNWGARYVCALAWCKAPHGWGPGGTFQSTVEHVLYAKIGQPDARPGQIDRQWWTWPRGAHSQKPDAFLDLVEHHFPAPRLELFARRNRLGWDTWGNEALEHVGIE